MNPIYLLIFYIITYKDKNKINTLPFIALILIYNNILKNNFNNLKPKSHNNINFYNTNNHLNDKPIKHSKELKNNLINTNYNKSTYDHYDKINIDALVDSYKILYKPLPLERNYIREYITSTDIIPNDNSTFKTSIYLNNNISNDSSNINTNLKDTKNIKFNYYNKDNNIILTPSKKPKFNISKGSAKFNSLYIKKVDTDISHISKATWIRNPKINETIDLDNNNFNIAEDSIYKFTLPTSIIKCDISDLFKVTIDFFAYIDSISDIRSNLIVTSNLSNLSLLDIYDKNKGVLFFDGYLEVTLDYSIPLKHTLPLKCDNSNCIINIPFSISGPIDLEYTIPLSKNSFNNLDISLTEVSFNVEKDFSKEKKLNDFISLYKKCDLTLDVKYSLEVFKNELFNY